MRSLIAAEKGDLIGGSGHRGPGLLSLTVLRRKTGSRLTVLGSCRLFPWRSGSALGVSSRGARVRFPVGTPWRGSSTVEHQGLACFGLPVPEIGRFKSSLRHCLTMEKISMKLYVIVQA